MTRGSPASGILTACALLLFASLVGAGLGRVKPPPAPSAAVSISDRPTWPYAWLLQADPLAANGGITSPRFDDVRATAAALGPSERNLRETLAIDSIQHWSQLSARGRRDAEADLRFVLHTQPEALLNAAFTARHENIPCGLWTEGGDVALVCTRMQGLRRICDQHGMTAEQQRWCFARGALPLLR